MLGVSAKALIGECALPPVRHVAQGRHAAVATSHPLATAAAINALRQGGNAIDAAVAAGLTLGVVDAQNSGIGGGCFLLVRLADGRFLAYDGRETAPAGATRDMFVRDGQAIPALSQTGALAIGVPGSLAVYDRVVREHGRLQLADLLLPAADLAGQGFPIDAAWATRLQSAAEDLRGFAESARVLLRPDGSPRAAGEVQLQPDLARSYRAIAENGVGWFYGGGFARATERWMKQHRGLITVDDFHSYRVRLREPVRTTYRDCVIHGFPPPSSGGVHVAQMLNMLEVFDLNGMTEADRVHTIIEVAKRAFADRAYWLGDADHVKVPRGLLDKAYARQLIRSIDSRVATEVRRHGEPPGAMRDWFGRHTTHFTVADAAGNWVACTATVNTSFGSKVIIPGTGVVMNNQMDDFSAQPGAPNAFGLVGAEANAVAPGKRPLSSMSPTIVERAGRPILTVGGAGGPTIITQVVLALVRHLDLGWPLERCLKSPRYHHQWRPDVVRYEKDLHKELVGELGRRGHKLQAVTGLGVSQAIGLAEDGGFIAVSEPRGLGSAAAE